MQFSVLGSLEVRDDAGVAVPLGGRQPRLLLALLVAAAPRAVPVEVIVDAIWGDEVPASAAGTVQSYVSRARSRLGAGVVVFDDAGYRLDVPSSGVAHLEFERLADEGRADLDAGRPGDARARLSGALQLWRGDAYGELADVAQLVGAAARLDERRLVAEEDRLTAELQLGRHAAVVSELTELVAAHPFRERLQEHLALALYRSGRQADALRALDRAGRLLREELGIEPGRSLRDLESAILAHDPSLDLPTGAVAGSSDLPPSSIAGLDDGEASPGVTPLVGRDAERDVLRQALDDLALDARFVVLEGEPGIGKTRLAEEAVRLVEEAGGWAVWGRADEGGAAPALWPWLPPLRALAEHGVALPLVLEELLTAEASTETGQAQSLQFELFEAFANALGQAGAAGPVVICLDDLQWADATSLELLGHLAGRLSRGVLVVGTVRQLEVGRNDAVTDALAGIARRPGSRRLALRGLDRDATGLLIEATAGRAIDPGAAAAIHGRAEGNPFFAIELAHLLDEDDGAAEVPGGVGDVIRRRLARLPTATVDLLGVAAVVGRYVDLAVLAPAAGLEVVEVLDVIEPAAVHRLVVEVDGVPGRLRFSHALVREVLLEDLTSLRRARLHLAVADAMEAAGAGIDDTEILAEHLWRAVPVGVGRRAADALERAAEVAVRRLAYGQAEDLLARAVQLRRAAGVTIEDRAAELQTLIRMLEVARAVRYFQGAPLDAVARARQLAEITGEPERVVDVLWFECAARFTAARFSEGEPMVRDLFAMSERHPDPGLRATALQNRGVLLWGYGRIGEACDCLDQAMELLALVTTPDDAFRAERRLVATCFWLFMHAAVGDMELDEVWATFEQLLADVPDPVGRVSVCGFAATTALAVQEWHQAERFVEAGLLADSHHQFGFWFGQMLMIGGVLHARSGDADAAVAEFEEGREIYTSLGAGSGVAAFEAAFAVALAGGGRVPQAAVKAAEARSTFERLRDGWCESWVLTAEASLAAAAGQPDDARRILLEAQAVATAQGAERMGERLPQALAPWLGEDAAADSAV